MGNRIPIPDEVIEPVEPVPPTFAEELQPNLLKIGEDSLWVLPEIIDGSATLADVLVDPDFRLSDFIDYDAQTNSVSFSGTIASKKKLQ